MLTGAKPTITRPGAIERSVLVLAWAFVGVLSGEALMYLYGIDEGIFVLRALGLVSGYVDVGPS